MRTPKWTIFEDISHSFEECSIWKGPPPSLQLGTFAATLPAAETLLFDIFSYEEKRSQGKRNCQWFWEPCFLDIITSNCLWPHWYFLFGSFLSRTEMPIFVQVFENNLALQLNIMGSFLPSSLDCKNCLGEDNERQCTANHLGTFNMTEETRPSPFEMLTQ